MRLRLKPDWTHQVQNVLRHRASSAPVAPVSTPAPLSIDAAWDEAFVRVESYLRAHHIESRVLITQLTTEVLSAARELTTQFPQDDPVTIAMRILHARIGEWLQQSVGEGDWADERFRARGRLALLRSELPQRCPEYFLSHEALPAPVASDLAHAQLVASPEFRPTTMPPAMLQFPLADMAEEKWVTFSRSTFSRAAASWALFISFLGVAWLATR